MTALVQELGRLDHYLRLLRSRNSANSRALQAEIQIRRDETERELKALKRRKRESA